jgi:hypothetical protein
VARRSAGGECARVQQNAHDVPLSADRLRMPGAPTEQQRRAAAAAAARAAAGAAGAGE